MDGMVTLFRAPHDCKCVASCRNRPWECLSLRGGDRDKGQGLQEQGWGVHRQGNNREQGVPTTVREYVGAPMPWLCSRESWQHKLKRHHCCPDTHQTHVFFFFLSNSCFCFLLFLQATCHYRNRTTANKWRAAEILLLLLRELALLGISTSLVHAV